MSTDIAEPIFDWVPIYEEIATRLISYRLPDRQRELITFLEDLRQRGLPITPLEDKDEAGRRFLFTEIDPFTFMGVFNRGIGEDKRKRIIGHAAAGKLGGSAPEPPFMNESKGEQAGLALESGQPSTGPR